MLTKEEQRLCCYYAYLERLSKIVKIQQYNKNK